MYLQSFDSSLRSSGVTSRALTLLTLFVISLIPAGALHATIDNVTLINADLDQGIAAHDPIVEAAVIDSNSLPTDQLNLRANINPGATSSVKSVKFILRLDGVDIHTQIENAAPYAAYGDVSGDYHGAVLAPGSYELVVTSHTSPGARGTRLDHDTLHFDVVELANTGPIESVTVIDAVTDLAMTGHDPLLPSAIVDLADLQQASQISILANLDPGATGIDRVHFDLDGQVDFRIEGMAPYALFGDLGVDIVGGSLTVGLHGLVVRATDINDSLVGTAYSIDFEIADTSGDGDDDGGGGSAELGPLPANTQDLFDAIVGTVAYVDGNGGSDSNACTASAPCASLGEGMALVNGGVADTLVIRGGSEESPLIYREGITLSRSGVTVLGYPGEVVILSGLVSAESGWTQDGNLYWRTYTTSLWEHPMTAYEVHYGEPQREKAPEMVVVDGEPLLTVYAKADIVAGSFWREGTANAPTKLWARFPGDLAPPSFGTIEVGDKAVLLTTRSQDVNGVTVAGLNLMYGPNSADSDTVQGGILDTQSSSGSTFRDLTVMYANGVGISLYGDNNSYQRVRAI